MKFKKHMLSQTQCVITSRFYFYVDIGLVIWSMCMHVLYLMYKIWKWLNRHIYIPYLQILLNFNNFLYNAQVVQCSRTAFKNYAETVVRHFAFFPGNTWNHKIKILKYVEVHIFLYIPLTIYIYIYI